MKTRVTIGMLALATMAFVGFRAVDARAAQDVADAPRVSAEAFYSEWIGALQGRDEAFDPLSYRDSDYLSDALVARVDEVRGSMTGGGYDPLLCAQDSPANWEITDVAVQGDQASAWLEMLYTGNPMVYRVPVDLVNVDGAWKLDGVRCGEAEQALLSAEQTVTQFYTLYLDAATRGSLLADARYRDLPFVTEGFVGKVDALVAGFSQGGYDPFLCAQDVPQTVTAGKAVVEGDTATVPVSTSFEGHGFEVTLARVDGSWAISDITCQVR